MENFVYLITDKATGRAAVVDPAWDVPAILAAARQAKVNITDILLTHSHHDHINGIEAVLEASDARVHLLNEEARFWGHALIKPQLHHGGDTLQLGETTINILHTPGHTPGSACYHINEDLITGDTLFVFGCGRCDLRGGDPEQMYDTLRRLREELPRQTRILPGHNYATQPTSSMAEQTEGNPFMHFEDKDRFVEYRMHIHDRVRSEPYHPILKQDLDI
jgi:hydroxyacylglutathione hydrolase